MARLLHAMYALGSAGPPPAFTVGDCRYRLIREVKHDFFAATAFYAAADDPSGAPAAVLKMGRVAPFCGLPLRWVGRALRDREVRFYDALSGVRGVPALLGRVGQTGFAHAYVPGRPLDPKRPVPDGFFDALDALLGELAARGIAYVDTNKPENVLLGDDGGPHLIDFQISWGRSPLLVLAPLRPVDRATLNLLHRCDLYHLLKHKRRLRPDELTVAERAAGGRPSLPIRVHRAATKPYFLVRRRLFRWLRETGRVLPETSK